MWISKAHFELIANRAREFREWHEQTNALKDAELARLNERLTALETERVELTQRLWDRQLEREKPPEALPERPDESWEAIMRQQIDELGKDQPDA